MYDLSPGSRSGDTARLILAYDRQGAREARFADLVQACHHFHLDRPAARSLIEHMVQTMHEHWADATEAALLTKAERHALWGRQFLHPSVLYGYPRS